MKKRTFILIGLLLIAVCTFAQAPEWQWAVQASGTDDDYGSAIARDDNGDLYVTGYFKGTATFGSYSFTSSDDFSDIFVAKMDVDGNWLWATQAGGTSSDRGYGITIDDAGNSYIIGEFYWTATFGSFSLTSSGWSDIFVAKLDADGNWLWVTQAVGIDIDSGRGITIDNAGNIYVTGYFWDTAIFGSYSLISLDWEDIFVAKLDTNGNWLWATQAGGSYIDRGYGITIDDAGNSYVTGVIQGTVTFGHYYFNSYGTNSFIAKMNANGNWSWATLAGNTQGFAIIIDDAGNSFVTGYFGGTATFGSYSLTSSGYSDIFVAKMNANGNWLWATQAGGISWDRGYGITIDDIGNNYVTGYFYETANFDSCSLTSSGGHDIFVAKMDTNGNWLWATQAGGGGHDEGYGITIDNDGNSYVIGRFVSTATFGSYSLISAGDNDIFVAKLNSLVSVDDGIIPTEIGLSNFPNPFNPSTTISFSLNNENTENTELIIYNLKGQKIRKYSIFPEQSQAPYGAGNNQSSIVWDGTDEDNQLVGSGIYFYKLEVNGKTEAVKKCLLLK